MYGLKEALHSFRERNDFMLTQFPVTHTNIWDAIWAIPVIVVLVMKVFFKLSMAWLSTVATVVGLVLSIFNSHPGNLSVGIFMGFFYGSAVFGFMYSVRNSFIA